MSVCNLKTVHRISTHNPPKFSQARTPAPTHAHPHTLTLPLSLQHTHMPVTQSQSSCNGCHCSLFTSCFVLSAILTLSEEEEELVSLGSKHTHGRGLARLTVGLLNIYYDIFIMLENVQRQAMATLCAHTLKSLNKSIQSYIYCW